MAVFDHTINELLKSRLLKREGHLGCDTAFYYGPIDASLIQEFRDFIENIKGGDPTRSTLALMINTPGGSIEAAEKMVEIMRFNYEQVYFIVPDFSMSAGTVLCMSGNKIMMDYSSSLGPIDPQYFNGSDWVPALGYLDKVEELIEKSNNGSLSPAEFAILQGQDLAALTRYEQARNLTVTLIKKWLVEYKFSDWNTHSSNNKSVTLTEKERRAEEIASQLGNNRYWHSHGRFIGIGTLQDVLRLKIDDYSADQELRELIRSYNDLIREYILRNQRQFVLHSTAYP